jgi:hypothetical protein
MFNFVSEKQEKKVDEVPFFEDADAANGWAGQSTGKSIETLKAEIIAHIGKLGGLVTGFEKGSFSGRAGYRIHYAIETEKGQHVPGYIDVASLPLKPVKTRYHYRNRVDPEATRMDKSMRMALYNVAMCLGSLWKLQRLSPGFAPLMPFMIMDRSGGRNLTQLWSETSVLKQLMPPKEDFTANGTSKPDDYLEGEVVED